MASGGSGSDNLILKIIGGAFATVIAPIVVAVGLKWTDKAEPVGADQVKPNATAGAKPDAAAEAKPDGQAVANPNPLAANPNPAAPSSVEAPKPANSASNHHPAPNHGSTSGSASPAGNRTEGHLVRLFNGVDKTGFYTWLAPSKPRTKPIGKNRDPDKQFTVANGDLHITGPTDGGLVTEKEYESYHLTVVYRWGEDSSPPRAERARQGGILLHCTGDDGAIRNHWMRSIRCDLTEGEAGSLRMVGSIPSNPISFTVTAEMRNVPVGEKHEIRYRYNPAAALTTLTGGYVNQLAHDPAWKNVKGFRGKHTQEKPVGKWNNLECVCDGGRITVRVNGTTVNEINDVNLRKGKIMIQTLRSELFIRAITLKPLE